VCLKVHKEVKSTVSGDIAFQTFTTLLVKKVFLAPSALVLYSLNCTRYTPLKTYTVAVWNSLPDNIRISANIDIFKCSVKTHLFNTAFATDSTLSCYVGHVKHVTYLLTYLL